MNMKVAWEQPARICRGQTIPDQHNCLLQDEQLCDQEENRRRIYIDFCTAFDKISHSILIAKLVRYGTGKWTTR